MFQEKIRMRDQECLALTSAYPNCFSDFSCELILKVSVEYFCPFPVYDMVLLSDMVCDD